MAQTEAGICNMALARCGQRQFIDSLDEETTGAEVCKVHYAGMRDLVLASGPWRFASRRATLALLSNVERDGWKYAYSLPIDCITPRRIWEGMRAPPADLRIPFALEGDETHGQILLTDQQDALLLYTARVDEVPLFPPHFVDALAWKLASELTLSLAVKPQVALAIEQKAERALAIAVAAELNKAREDKEPNSEFVRGR